MSSEFDHSVPEHYGLMVDKEGAEIVAEGFRSIAPPFRTIPVAPDREATDNVFFTSSGFELSLRGYAAPRPFKSRFYVCRVCRLLVL